MSHWLLRIPLIIVFIQQGISKYPVNIEDAQSFELPFLFPFSTSPLSLAFLLKELWHACHLFFCCFFSFFFPRPISTTRTQYEYTVPVRSTGTQYQYAVRVRSTSTNTAYQYEYAVPVPVRLYFLSPFQISLSNFPFKFPLQISRSNFPF